MKEKINAVDLAKAYAILNSNTNYQDPNHWAEREALQKAFMAGVYCCSDIEQGLEPVGFEEWYKNRLTPINKNY